MFDGLELRSRLAELFAGQRVGHVEIDQLARRAESIRGQQSRGDVQQMVGACLIAIEERCRRAIEMHRRDRPRAVDPMRRLDRGLGVGGDVRPGSVGRVLPLWFQSAGQDFL